MTSSGRHLAGAQAGRHGTSSPIWPGPTCFGPRSITAGLAGQPTRFLTSFDPVSTPAAMVRSSAVLRPSEVLGQLVDSTEALADAIGGLDAEAWLLPAEAPPGYVAIHAVALHALWDSWIHERDILIPLGIEPTVEDDEVAASLLYAAALGPAYLATTGSERVGTFGVTATDLDVHFLVDVGPAVVVRESDGGRGCPRLAGPGVVLTESLSCRGAPPAAGHWGPVDDRRSGDGLRPRRVIAGRRDRWSCRG